jgi:protein O-GlcNAc transferase
MSTPKLLAQTDAEREHNRGMAFAKANLFGRAIECFRRAAEIDPELFAAQANLGALLVDRGRVDEAIAPLQAALRLRPRTPEIHNNLANVLSALGQLDEAAAHCRRSLELRADNAGALTALGNVLKDQGLLDEARNAYARAALLRPDLPQPASNLLYLMHFHPGQSPNSILVAHRAWGKQCGQPLKALHRPHGNNPDPERKLKIGYVSADFREHPVGRFFLPQLENHDRQRVAVFCYSNLHGADAMTDRIRAKADFWRNIAERTDEQAAEKIRADGIDILMDLTMHMRASRLLVFARKPAPVQATYLAYCSTTGLEAMDYRLSDPYLDPAGADKFYVEPTVRLRKSYWCYQANDAAPAVNALPAASASVITFACLNNFCKVTPPTLALWAELLSRMPNSRLILHAPPGTHCDRVRSVLGVTQERLAFVGRAPMAEYFARYHRIDIALDPFPCAGGTTTCDALWMGVPVITLPGETAVSRSGVSILSNIGRTEWIAESAGDYLRIAGELCRDLKALAETRRSLRGRMMGSALMDGSQFARNVENAYREMWRTWCYDMKNPRGAGG